MSRRLTGALALTLALFLESQGSAAEKLQTPLNLIRSLSVQIGNISEDTGSEKEKHDAIERTRRALDSYVAAGGDPADFIEKTEDGTRPLILAAYFGYPEIVAELLKNPGVVAAIDEVDARGFSAWTYSNFAMGQSAFLCNPDIMKNIFGWVPYLVNLPYYMAEDESPYRKVRTALERSGAHADMGQVKRQWLASCKKARDETRKQVADAADLLDVLGKIDPRMRDEIRARSK